MNENNLAATRGLLLFRSGERCFALPDAAVLEIVPAGIVSPLPFTPSWVEGLANVGGRILPQASLAALLGDAAGTGGDLLVVATPQAQCALHVDEALARIELPADAVQAFMTDDDRAAAYISGEFSWQGRIVLLLDSEGLGELFAVGEAPAGDSAGLLGRLDENEEEAHDSGLACLRFRCAGEAYAMPLAQVGEIIACTGITRVPGAPAMVAGIATLRDEPLLMVSLSVLLGLPASEATTALLLENGGLRLGLLVDAVDGMSTFPDSALRLLHEAAGDVAGVLHDEQGLVLGLLDSARLLRPEREMQLAPFVPARRQRAAERERIFLPHLQVKLGDEMFGIPLELVQRIAPWNAPEVVHDDEGRVDAVVQVEGEVLPVLAAQRLHQAASSHAAAAWVIVGRDGNFWAVAVDEARAIVQVAADSLEKIGNGAGLVDAVARVDDSLLSIVSLHPLLDAAA
ncbi:MAG: chemotaxis protein CheW [Pedobacter sp.]|nr:chemotaxis protein CheW [Pedobacter sp.]